ncbi:hypothetical protein ACJMK2_021994 [Sinanodonta woodiana]|uniref:C-type lectin domain-containing protein n=1 Tax=Sinanodonta woodiana TaxID=1069815 RepID=A0ABD3TJR1_SINWO
MTVQCGVGFIFVFLQMQLAFISPYRMTGNNTLYSRASKPMSWLTAREFCANASHNLLTSIRDIHAFNSLTVGEFAWINAMEYSFCYPSKADNTVEECFYVTVAQEDKRSNQTYICSKDHKFETTEDKLPFQDAVQSCLKTKHVLQVVNSFTLPLILPGNKTSWIDRFDRKSINDSLKPNQRVNETCLGVIKLSDERFSLCTTGCYEEHTVLCEMSKLDTAETLTRKVKMLPTLAELNKEILVLRRAGEDTQTDDGNRDLIPIVIGSSIGGVIFLAVIIVVATVVFRKYGKTQFSQVPACRV